MNECQAGDHVLRLMFIFIDCQIIDMHSGLIDQARDMVNVVSVNGVGYSKLSYDDKHVDKR